MELSVTHPHDDDELASLARQAHGGSARAFEELAGRVRERVQKWARRLTRDDDDAEDVTQQVLLRLHERAGDFEGRSKFTSWLFSVTRNVSLNSKRTEMRRAELLAEQQVTDEAVSDTPAVNDSSALVQLVQLYYTELPARQREVFEMIDLRGIPPAEAAKRLGVEPATVRATLHFARRTIRSKILEQHKAMVEDFNDSV